MALKLMYITNQKQVAMIAEKSGVDWIFIDLEINGKEQRQGHLDTVISRHSIDDVAKIKKVLNETKLLVRVNPIYNGSKKEIDRVISGGADIIMLPFFKTKHEVETFVNYIDGRAEVCLLFETAEAVENIDGILSVDGIDYIHIGLNDLHLSLKKKFMFELLANGTVEKLCSRFATKGIPYGFGGIARPGQGTLPAEKIIAEHYRLGSSMTILSRSFCDIKKCTDVGTIEKTFKNGIKEIRDFEKHLISKQNDFFEENQLFVKEQVRKIVQSL